MRFKSTAITALAAIALTACGTSPGELVQDIADNATEAIGGVVEELGSDGPSDESPPAPDGGAQAPDDQQPGGEAPAPADPGGGPGASLDDNQSVGFHGPAMLRGSVARLVLEVDVQQGLQVSQAALDHLVSTMRNIVDKPAGVEVTGGNTFASDRTSWTSAQLHEVAQANRDTSSGGDTVSVYLLYVKGGFVVDGAETNAVGVAHRASEMAVFPQKWAGMGGLLGSDSQIERAVLVHEWGHLLGLVNIGYTSDIDHEDPEHKGHSKNQGSAMFWAIESTLMSQIFTGPPPDRFDDADLADLDGIRTGKYRG